MFTKKARLWFGIRSLRSKRRHCCGSKHSTYRKTLTSARSEIRSTYVIVIGDVLQSIVRCASSVQMGRGLASKGKRVEGSAPEWLNPIKEGEGGGGGGFGGGSSVRQVEEEKPRKRRGGDNDDLDEPVKKGIQWKPLAFLVLMVLPGLAPVLINVADRWVHA